MHQLLYLREFLVHITRNVPPVISHPSLRQCQAKDTFQYVFWGPKGTLPSVPQQASPGTLGADSRSLPFFPSLPCISDALDKVINVQVGKHVLLFAATNSVPILTHACAAKSREHFSRARNKRRLNELRQRVVKGSPFQWGSHAMEQASPLFYPARGGKDYLRCWNLRK